MTAFAKLSRPALRALKPGASITEHGITYTKLPSGDGRWSVNVMVARARHHQVVGTESEGFTRTQAEELVARLKVAKREKSHGVRKARAVTFRDAAKFYLDHLEATGGKDIPKKRQRLTLHLNRLLGSIQLATLTQTDLRRYSAARAKEGATPGTVNRELAVVSHLLRLAGDAEELALLPGLPFRVPRLKEPEGKPVYLKPAEMAKLLEAAARDENEHVLAFSMVGLHTGMRLSSILRIRLDEVDIDRRVIWIDRDKAGERQQPITADLAAFLKTYMRKQQGPWLFPSVRSGTGHATNVYKAFRRSVKAAGLAAVITPHKMRHTMATNAAHAGVDAPTLQAMGGWKSRRMVERYTHAGAMTDAMDKLSAAYNPPAKKAARRREVTPELRKTRAKS
ncbi:site-specific integrase [Lysobacter firmicutimachus]|uniref:Site-specific integrase n=1 Tax=Lysobacter firmicutimachus TaxID=1792846 RepID=A0AAU8MVX1_9GAMM